MPRLIRALLLSFATALIAPTPTAFAAPNSETIAQLEQLPASNPYHAALLRLVNLPEADRAALQTWANQTPASGKSTPGLTAEQQTLATELREVVAAVPPLGPEAWPRIPNPKDPDNPASLNFALFKNLRDISQIALKSADSLPADAAINTYSSVARIGGFQHTGLTLAGQMAGATFESMASTRAARRIGEFSPDGLRRLSAAWSNLHPLPASADVLAGERDAFFMPMTENIVVPGLHALLADPDAGRVSAEAAPTTPAAYLFRDLRLSGIVRLGPGEEQISLENSRTHETIVLRSGRSIDGLELVSIDFGQHRALIRRDEHDAFVDLRTKRVVALDLAARQLREMFGSLKGFSEADIDDDALAKILALVRAHPEGVDGYTRDLIVHYQTMIDQQLALIESAKFPAETESAEQSAPASNADPLFAFITFAAPSYASVGRKLHQSALYRDLLQAAIHHRLGTLGQNAPDTAAPADPWSVDGAGFAYEAAPGGGFVLRSRYEVAPDAPLTYKFATPDAGYQRPKN